MKLKLDQANNAFKFIFWSVFLLLTSCTAGAVKLAHVPAPPGAERGIKFPEFNTEIDLATNFIVADLKKKTGEVDTTFYTLTAPTTWKNLTDFYDAELKSGGFVRISEVPTRTDRALGVFYERDNFPGKQTVVVSLIEVKSDQNQAGNVAEAHKYQFLMLGTDAK